MDTTRGIFHAASAVVGNGPVMINSLVVLFYLAKTSPLKEFVVSNNYKEVKPWMLLRITIKISK